MKLLLDTHAWLWAMEDDPRLSSAAREAIQASQDIAVSIASFWEIAIKVSLGKIVLDRAFPTDYFLATTHHGIQLMAIEMRHLEKVASLPLVHRDPFDRLIVAQAMCADRDLISSDQRMDVFSVNRVWKV